MNLSLTIFFLTIIFSLVSLSAADSLQADRSRRSFLQSGNQGKVKQSEKTSQQTATRIPGDGHWEVNCISYKDVRKCPKDRALKVNTDSFRGEKGHGKVHVYVVDGPVQPQHKKIAPYLQPPHYNALKNVKVESNEKLEVAAEFHATEVVAKITSSVFGYGAKAMIHHIWAAEEDPFSDDESGSENGSEGSMNINTTLAKQNSGSGSDNGSDKSHVLDGIYWALNNLSQPKLTSVFNVSMWGPYAYEAPRDATLLSQANVLFVISANDDEEFRVKHAGGLMDLEKTIVVGAAHFDLNRKQWTKTDFTTFGQVVDIYAPGQELKCLEGGALCDGTSYATPLVTGFAVKLLRKFPILHGRPVQLKELILALAPRIVYEDASTTTRKPLLWDGLEKAKRDKIPDCIGEGKKPEDIRFCLEQPSVGVIDTNDVPFVYEQNPTFEVGTSMDQTSQIGALFVFLAGCPVDEILGLCVRSYA